MMGNGRLSLCFLINCLILSPFINSSALIFLIFCYFSLSKAFSFFFFQSFSVVLNAGIHSRHSFPIPFCSRNSFNFIPVNLFVIGSERYLIKLRKFLISGFSEILWSFIIYLWGILLRGHTVFFL